MRLFHRENECYVVAEGSFAQYSSVVEDGNENLAIYHSYGILIIHTAHHSVHCRQRRVDLKSHNRLPTSANTYWQIEKESDPRSGKWLALYNYHNNCPIL